MSAVAVSFGLVPNEVEACNRILPIDSYAESLYADFARATDDEVRFDLAVVSGGSAADLRGTAFGKIIEAPGFAIAATQLGTEIHKPQFVEADGSSEPDLAATVEGFNATDLPVAQGRYRIFDVDATIGGDTRRYQALEFCWTGQQHCVVLDPAIVFADSMVNTRLRLVSEGWGMQVIHVAHGTSKGDAPAAACGLASNPSITDKYYYWGPYWVEYKNIFGMVLVRKDLGAQKSGIRCNTSCLPAPYGYSNASSCYGTLGWNCACDNDFGFGTSGGSGKWIAETKCTHKWAGSASASVTVLNQGSINVALSWNVDGGVDARGGQIIDTCGYY